MFSEGGLLKMNSGIIVCARLKSRRVPQKALTLINGKPLLSHLMDRLRKTGLKIVVAVPSAELEQWQEWFDSNQDVLAFDGHDLDPLARIYDAAVKYKIENIIRITHDKIFVDPYDVTRALEQFKLKKLDYLFSSTLTDGTGFEIISINSVALAREQFSNVEHVSYAIKAVTNNSWNMPFDGLKGVRLLCDYPEDIGLLETLLSTLGNNVTKKDVEKFCQRHEWLNDLNRLPNLTVYTCGFNAEKYIEQCISSVEMQEGFRRYEYILIDDHSTDKTMQMMAKFKSKYQNVKLLRTSENRGLASASNLALKEARGKYIMRLDADDFLIRKTALREMLGEICSRTLDAIYPANYFGSMDVIQQPELHHHVGGAIFRTSAINHIKFTDGLRGYEGLDLWARAKTQLKIGYFARPIFFYRQHAGSLSKTNLEERAKIKSHLEVLYGAEVASNRPT